MSNRPDLSNELQELRRSCGEMTQRELAVRVGVSRQTICAIENGKQMPALDVAMRIAQVFDVAVEDVFGRSERMYCDQEPASDLPDGLTIWFSMVKSDR